MPIFQNPNENPNNRSKNFRCRSLGYAYIGNFFGVFNFWPFRFFPPAQRNASGLSLPSFLVVAPHGFRENGFGTGSRSMGARESFESRRANSSAIRLRTSTSGFQNFATARRAQSGFFRSCLKSRLSKRARSTAWDTVSRNPGSSSNDPTSRRRSVHGPK